MPVKRRIEKARRQLDSEDLEDLFYGPGSALLEGYCSAMTSSHFEALSATDQALVVDAMREDWERHGAAVLEAWRLRTPHDLYLAREYYGDPTEPWAQREFGDAD